MNDDYEKNFRKFSVYQRCPRCSKLSLHSANGKIICGSCGFEQNIPSIGE